MVLGALLTLGFATASAAHRTHAADTPKRGGSLTSRARGLAVLRQDHRLPKRVDLAAEQINELSISPATTVRRQPWPATSYIESKDGLTYTFTLRKGVKFSTGKLMTSADVKFSIDDDGAGEDWLGLPRRCDQERGCPEPEHGRLPPEIWRARSSPTSLSSQTGSSPRTSTARSARRSTSTRSAPARSCGTSASSGSR